MNPDSILEQLLLRAARAAFDDRFTLELAPAERRVLEEAQAMLQGSGRPDLHYGAAIQLVDRKRRTGAIDAAFAGCLRCTILLDPDVAQVDRAAQAQRSLARTSRELPAGSRRRALRAMAARIAGAIERRRRRPARALAFDRAAVRLNDHPRHLADVLVDHLLCGDEAQARQVYLEARLTCPGPLASELECLVHDDIDLAALTVTHPEPATLAPKLPGADGALGGSPQDQAKGTDEMQRVLRRHVCRREQPDSRGFWLGLVHTLCREIESNPALNSGANADLSDSPLPNPGPIQRAAEEAILDVLGELITRSWRVFQGTCTADLQAYLRGMLLQREWDTPRRMRMALDPGQ